MQNSNKKNNILIITQRVDRNDPILGFFHRWVEEFSKHYKKVTVICLEKGEYNLPDNVEVKSLGKENRDNRFLYVVRFYRYVIGKLFSKEKPKRIFVHMNEIYILLLIPLWIVRKVMGIKLLWWKAHGHLSLLSKIIYHFVDVVVTSSKIGFNINTARRKVVGQGIDIDRFDGSGRKNSNTKIIVAVGRFSKTKRFEDLIEAARLLKQEGKSFKVRILGVTASDEYEKYLKSLINKYNLKEIVIFEKPISNEHMPEFYKRADIIVNMSETDSLDKVVLEAMACGVIPIVATRSYKLILEQFNLYVEKRDVKSLVETLKKVLSLSEEEKNRLRKDMRSIVEKKHGMVNLVEKIANL
ncbi:MAG: glycosyltransferase [Candidatus Pacebacteria bacterium]|nr:glycosyltransferase [Candidatus Paceibacterota bacterium]